MRRLLFVWVCVLLGLFGRQAWAGDLLSQITSSKQDLLAIVQITEQEPEASHFRVLFIFPQSKRKGVQTSHVFNEDQNPVLQKGGIYLVSLNREQDGYKNAFGIHEIDNGNYRTAVFTQRLNGDLAALQWFMNSGGKDTNFFGINDRMYVERDGVERQIYPATMASPSQASPSLNDFSLERIPSVYWGIAGLALASSILMAFVFSTYFPDKRKMIPFFLVDAVIVVIIVGYIGWKSSASSGSEPLASSHITQEQAIEIVQTAHPELGDYPDDGLPPRRIRLQADSDGWYVAFMQLGSGRPLIEARCFFVGNDRRIEEKGVYQPNNQDTGLSDLDPSTCQFFP